MSRPLLVTDCDEVLLHMVRHFGEWLDEAHDIDFAPHGGAFADALTRRSDGKLVPAHAVWPLLDGFFRTEMARQTLVPGAGEALGRIAEVADIVILTNLEDWCHAGRVAQLAAHGIAHRVICNQGGKGAAVRRLLDELQPSAAAFVDDLPQHHESVAEHAPDVHRLHMVAEPWIAETIRPAPHAHARIDDWGEAADWLLARLNKRQRV
jgi:hypothetical protein